MVIGYTSGVFDLFHIGHLNLLKNSKSLCDKLIVGVTTDELVSYKNKQPVINHYERMEIVRNIKHVDVVVPQPNMEKMEMWKKLQFDIMFVGDDWFENDRWQFFEEEFKKIGVRVIYFPYTKSTSSTLINTTLEELRDEK